MTDSTRQKSSPQRRTIPRLGPRPLHLHLLTAGTTWQSSLLALPLLKHGLPNSNPALMDRVRALAQDVAEVDPDDLYKAVEAELKQRAHTLASGILAYRHHPYERELPDVPVIWQDGTTRLFDYGTSGGIPVLIVPSLINRAYILDLKPDRSMLRYMAQHGLRPLLVDWAAPGEAERAFDLTAYVAGRLEQALDAVLDVSVGPVALMGYCMGGLLAMALATRRKRDISRLALLATPWDFHVPELPFSNLLGAAAEPLCTHFSVLGQVPTDVLQGLFAAGDPQLAIRKYGNFAKSDPNSARAINFVAIEDWVNDGVPLALPVAKECLGGWYGDNLPVKGEWRIAGRPVQPSVFDRPSLIIVPYRDRTVPPSSAEALVNQLPNAEILRLDLGHIGIIVSSRAPQAVWSPLTSWLCGEKTGTQPCA